MNDELRKQILKELDMYHFYWQSGDAAPDKKSADRIMQLIAAHDIVVRIEERSRIDYHIQRLNNYLEKNDIIKTFEAMRNEYMQEIVEPHKRRLAELRGKGEAE